LQGYLNDTVDHREKEVCEGKAREDDSTPHEMELEREAVLNAEK
jgi:hypothetical protein